MLGANGARKSELVMAVAGMLPIVSGTVRADAEGLICYPMPGTRDGRVGDHVLPAPPFILTDDQMDEVIDKRSCAVDAVLETI